MPMSKSLDRVDRRILDELQGDARVSNQELAKRVGLSPAPCWRRLRRLELLLDGVPVERAVRFGDVVEEIARETDAFDADLVAVTERRRPWWRPALARIVDRVRARVRVPVLALSGGAR